jgi:hypothetical protein|tara:strand:+ start:119 stop:1387 length:1269 start_codon:yes stop_codon:yes gene_type:complete
MGRHSKSNDDKKIDNEVANKESENSVNNLIIYIFFTFGFIVIFFSLISAIFPGLIISIIGDGEFLEPFEISSIGLPIIIVNIVIFTLLILHFKHKLPILIENKIKRIFEFDLSQKTSLVFLIIILGIYVAFSANELSYYEGKQFGDFLIVEKAIEIWPDGESDISYVSEQLSRHVRMALLVASEEIFNNIKIIPYIASILLLVVTYFLTVKFSKKNFTGLLSVILILQSDTFLKYDTIAVYENFWVLFYVFSIYLIFKNPKISSPFYLLSIFSKAITVLMLPISIIVTLLSDISKNKKIFVLLTYGIVIGISMIIFQYSDSIYGKVIDINISEFWIGFTTLPFNLRFDIFLLLFLLPVSVGLFIKSRNGDRNSISLMVLIGGTILVTPILEMITNFYFVYPYRYIPLIVFFSIAASSLLSKK